MEDLAGRGIRHRSGDFPRARHYQNVFRIIFLVGEVDRTIVGFVGDVRLVRQFDIQRGRVDVKPVPCDRTLRVRLGCAEVVELLDETLDQRAGYRLAQVVADNQLDGAAGFERDFDLSGVRQIIDGAAITSVALGGYDNEPTSGWNTLDGKATG